MEGDALLFRSLNKTADLAPAASKTPSFSPTRTFFDLGEGDVAALAYQHAAEQKKSSFALEHAIVNTEWQTPRYIAEGLRWLAQGNPAPTLAPAALAAELVAEVIEAVDGGHANG
ncbi:hypothetical protein [Sphingomonas sp. Ant20]|uniref:hypothetical protein n=1 Tax=Sphingomonas sp. Ant20 TaxID=104605 RepID=UPI0027423363|nr:hypothetical protein [Sphingomonas sp. Ant20]